MPKVGKAINQSGNSKLELSIVIPTHNRANILKQCLKKLTESKFPTTKFEVVIVDDASTDNTEEVVNEFKEKLNLNYHKQKKAGQGVARNYAIEQAKAEVIIFIGDDIFVNKNFLEEHYNFHQQNKQKNFAMLGLILWDPEINISALMDWSTNGSSLFGKFGGHQFAFEKLSHNKPANYNFFYTSNISLKKELLMSEKFDPWFDGYGWEDIELGYRLETNSDLKLIYNSQAIAYHHHEISLKEFKNRMYQIGHASHLFQAKHPEIKIRPSKYKQFVFSALSNNLFLFILKICNKVSKNKLNPLYFYCLSKKYYLKGFKNIPNKLK
jgi:glycosyltransferase involved in cell wall biosynthesis